MAGVLGTQTAINLFRKQPSDEGAIEKLINMWPLLKALQLDHSRVPPPLFESDMRWEFE